MNRPFFRRPLPLLFLTAWAGVVFFLLYRLTFPYQDSWAYFSPAVFASAPGHLFMPLLGSFDGADHAWGLHWPGTLLLKSTVFPFLPKTPLLWVGSTLVEWLLVAALTAAWVREWPSKAKTWTVPAVFVLVLLDRLLFDVAGFERSEFFGAIALLGAVWGSWRQISGPVSTRRDTLVSILSFFLLPLLHPVCLLAGAALLVLFWVARIWSPKPSFPYLAAVTGAYLAGLGAFFLYFLVHPTAWHLLRTHVEANIEINYESRSHPHFGRTLWSIATIPSYACETLLFLSAFLLSLLAGWKDLSLLRKTGEWPPRLLACFTFLVVFCAAQSTHNICYSALSIPFAIVVVCLGCRMLPGASGNVLLIFLCCFQTLYLAGKMRNAAQAGWPNPRRDMLELRQSLPPSARHILIPVVMWETARIDPGPIFINTLPFNSLPENRLRYEEGLYAQLQPGDLLLLNRLQDIPPLHVFDPDLWEKIGEKKCVYHHSEIQDGFDIVVWKKK